MGIMTTSFVIIRTIIFVTIIGLGAQGRSEFSGTVSHPNPRSPKAPPQR